MYILIYLYVYAHEYVNSFVWKNSISTRRVENHLPTQPTSTVNSIIPNDKVCLRDHESPRPDHPPSHPPHPTPHTQPSTTRPFLSECV